MTTSLIRPSTQAFIKLACWPFRVWQAIGMAGFASLKLHSLRVVLRGGQAFTVEFDGGSVHAAAPIKQLEHFEGQLGTFSSPCERKSSARALAQVCSASRGTEFKIALGDL